MVKGLRVKVGLVLAGWMGLCGCDALTAPVSIPEAIGENANFSMSGPVVDQDGKPLEGVVMSREWSHHFWTPGYGGHDTDEHSLQRVDGHYVFSERGTHIEAKFSKEGYFPETYRVDANDSHYVKTLNGDWKISKDFPMVMYSAAVKPEVEFRWEWTVDLSEYPSESVLRFEPLARNRMTVEEAAKQPKVFYITMEKGEPRAKNASGDLDAAEVNLPESITLHITDPEGGFVRIEPKAGFEPMRAAMRAPTAGYVQDLKIDRARLLEMRKSTLSRIAEAHEYFYFKAANHYGKGEIEWTQPATDKEVHPAAFRYYLWRQGNENDPNLATLVEALKR